MKIEFKNVSFAYSGLTPVKKEVLKNISFKIDKNEFIALIGPSGSGKTTLLQHFTGLLKPTDGMILVDGQDIWQKKFFLSQLRKRIGLVFQFPETQLFEETVFDDIAYGPKNLKISQAEIEERVRGALKLVGLDFEQFKDRSPHHLSGGEKRRVAIAGILAMAPEMIILDEPTAGLDPAGCRRIVNILKELNRQNIPVMLSTHHLDLALEAADRIIVLSEGKILFDGRKDKAVRFIDEKLKTQFTLPQIVMLSKELYRKRLISDWRCFSVEDLRKALSMQV